VKAIPVFVVLLAALVVTPAMLFAASDGPTVTITAPEPGITVTSDTLDIGVEYSAPEGLKITRVAVLVDGVKIGAIDLDPAQVSGGTYFAWHTADYHDGHHEITARAVDSKGRVGAYTITLLLQRGIPDLANALRIVSPKHGQTVAGRAEIRLEGDPEDTVRYVIFLVDRVFKGMTNVRPFSYRWDSTRYLNGLHSLQARAYLNDGSDYLTAAVEVRVDNPSGATTMRQPEEKPVAPLAPEPSATQPARAESPALPAPMHTESLGPPLLLVEAAEPEVGRPGTAPFVSPTGDLIAPLASGTVERSPQAAPTQIAALPSEAAEEPTAPAASGTVAADIPLPSSGEVAPVEVAALPGGEPGGPAPSLPASSLPPASVAAEPTSLAPVISEAAPPEVAALPSGAQASPMVTSAPAPPAPATVPAEIARAAVVTRRAAPAGHTPSATGVQVAMLPPLPTAPAPAPKVAAEPAPPTTTVYVVRAGDCLWDIADKLGVSPRELAEANGISNPSIIHAGQELKVRMVQLYADGTPVATDTPVTISNGQTIAPFRAIVERFGGKVAWDSATRSATGSARGRSIAVTIGSDQAKVDGGAVTMGAPAELRNDRTVVPLRFLGNALSLTLRCQTGVVSIASAQ